MEKTYHTGIADTIVIAIFAFIIFSSIVAVWVTESVNDRWVAWQECIQTRSGGDASLEWCDEAFDNPARLEE